MLAKSKKLVFPLVALLVACMTVEADTTPDVPVPQVCTCKIGLANNVYFDRTQVACASVGQANGAVWNADRGFCQIGTESAYHSFRDVCPTYSDEPSPGYFDYGDPVCNQDVNVPQSCSCANPSGVNTTAQTQRACTLINNTGTMVGDKCVVSTEAQYTAFTYVCPTLYKDSKAICSV